MNVDKVSKHGIAGFVVGFVVGLVEGAFTQNPRYASKVELMWDTAIKRAMAGGATSAGIEAFNQSVDDKWT